MATRKTPSKAAGARKSDAKPAPRKATKKPAKTPSAKPAPRKAATPASKKAAAKREPAAKEAATTATEPKAESASAERERVIFPRELYAERKEDVKAPIKDLGLKWQYLGPGKGRYAGEGVQIFVQHTDAGADFTVWGDDADAVTGILAAWRAIAGKETFEDAKAEAAAAAKEEKQEAQSEEMRLWELAKPTRRAGEPEGFFKRRVAEWEARKPAS